MPSPSNLDFAAIAAFVRMSVLQHSSTGSRGSSRRAFRTFTAQGLARRLPGVCVGVGRGDGFRSVAARYWPGVGAGGVAVAPGRVEDQVDLEVHTVGIGGPEADGGPD
jgi:hypothetical protein